MDETANAASSSAIFGIEDSTSPLSIRIFAFSELFLLAFLSAVANLALLVTILLTPKYRLDPTYILMVALAISNLGHVYVGIYPIGVSLLLDDYVPSQRRRFLFLNVIYLFWYTTCLSYATIAVNRFFLVCFPRVNALLFRPRNVVIFVAFWPVIALASMTPMFLGHCCGFEFSPNRWLLHYEEGREHELNLQLVICYVASASTTAIGVLCYTATMLKLKRAEDQMTLHMEEYRRLQETDIKLTIQFLLLTVVFTFTWITLHYEASLGNRSHQVINYLGLVGYVGLSGVNPFIYLAMNKGLRSAMWTTFKGLIGKGHKIVMESKKTTPATSDTAVCCNGNK